MAPNELSNKKAPGLDNIPADLLKTTNENTQEELYDLIKRCYEQSKLPEDFKNTAVIIPKKTNTK